MGVVRHQATSILVMFRGGGGEGQNVNVILTLKMNKYSLEVPLNLTCIYDELSLKNVSSHAALYTLISYSLETRPFVV